MSELRLAVAIPARNEAERIEACLAALARQRDRHASPLSPALYTVLVYADSCTDATVETVRAWAGRTSFPVRVVAENGGAGQAHAGRARRRAMDLAADLLEREGAAESFLLTTDADSCVGVSWLTATLEEFARGADAVAGYVDVHPQEMMALSSSFIARSRLEDRYLALVAEIHALCDPVVHDPWPNHRMSSGASLAVRLPVYRAVGGMPSERTGEDAAFTRRLEAAGFRVRHSLAVRVSTSCRLVGRIAGGAADTMRRRHETSDADCGELAPAAEVLRSALERGRQRRGAGERASLPPRRASSLTVAELPTQIDRAERILRRLRAMR